MLSNYPFHHVIHHVTPQDSSLIYRSHTDMEALTRNVQVLAEGIARFIYNVSELVSVCLYRDGLCVIY